ncbi:hypothetical protein D3C87_2094630 [compost metagenome]
MHSSIPEHERVLEAILRGDGQQAAQMMRAHVTLLGEGLSDLLHFLHSSDNHGLLADIA